MDGPGGWRRPSRSVMTKMMKESVKTGHPTGLPEKLLRLFAPNQPLRYVKENCKQKKPPAVPWSGIGAYVSQFAAPGDPEYEPKSAEFPQPRLYNNKEYELQVRLDEETKLEKEKRLREWKHETAKKDLEEKISKYDPNNDHLIEGDPYKTLFVSRLSYEVTERKLRHEFEEFGPIKRTRLVLDISQGEKPRGYAFIEYEHKKDMKEAYKQSDGRKIEGRRILVDVERGRTVENWRPMRLGGGLGGDSRLPKEPRKKILADAVARGVAPPPSADDPGTRRDEPRGPARDYDRGPPPDRYGGPPRGPPMDRYGGPPRGPPRDYDRDRADRDRGGFDRGGNRYRDDRGATGTEAAGTTGTSGHATGRQAGTTSAAGMMTTGAVHGMTGSTDISRMASSSCMLRWFVERCLCSGLCSQTCTLQQAWLLGLGVLVCVFTGLHRTRQLHLRLVVGSADCCLQYSSTLGLSRTAGWVWQPVMHDVCTCTYNVYIVHV